MTSPLAPIAPLTRRDWLRAAAFAVGAGLSGCTAVSSSGSAAHLPAGLPAPEPTPSAGTALPPGWRLVGASNARHGLEVDATPVGGLSGLDFDPATQLFWALSDDRSQRAPARLYTFSLPVSAAGRGVDAPQFQTMIALRQSDGAVYPSASSAAKAAGAGPRPGAAVPDPEALRLLPGTDQMVWTSEGDIRNGQPPTLTLARRDGTALQALPLPAELVTMGQGIGPRNNETLEGLALVPGTDQVWLGMEGPLKQDKPGPDGRPLCRLTHYRLGQRRALAQRVYPLEDGPAVNGISELLAWGPHHLLVLERAFSLIGGFDVRLYLVDTRSGSDTLGQPRLDAAAVEPLRKTLLVDFGALAARRSGGFERVDNLEGMAWGPVLPSGERTLVLIADDNFLVLQQTQIVVLALPDTLPDTLRAPTAAR